MSAIVLFGSHRFSEAFGNAIPAGYDVRVIDPADLDDPSVENFPDGIACIVDLTIDLDEKLRCADFVGRSAAGAVYFTNILTTTATWVAGAFDGVTVVVDRMSVPYLNGAVIDFVDTIEKQGFTIDNPNATGSCACGDSFH